MPFSIRTRFAAHPKRCRARTCCLALRIRALGYLPTSRAESLNHFLQRRTRAEIPALDYLLLQTLLKTDRKSTRLNSSHGYISYAVFCLKKKKKKYTSYTIIQIT